jgi:hypothetical protein
MTDYRMTPAGRKAAEKGGTSYVGATKSGEDVARAQDKERLTDTSRLGAMGKRGKGPAPKQADYPSTKAWGDAFQKWREAPDAEAEGQKKALRGMK